MISEAIKYVLNEIKNINPKDNQNINYNNIITDENNILKIIKWLILVFNNSEQFINQNYTNTDITNNVEEIWENII